MSLSADIYYKPSASKTFAVADERDELDWIANLASGEGDTILLRELVMYVWAYAVSDSVTERVFLQRMIDHRLSQLRVIGIGGR